MCLWFQLTEFQWEAKDGDVRWITPTALVDVNLPVENAMNSDVLWQFSMANYPISKTAQGKDVVPLLDEFKRVRAIAYGDGDLLSLVSET